MQEFKVYKNQIPNHLIDLVLDEHQTLKTGKFAYFRAQGETVFEKPILDDYGNQVNSIHNPHLLGFYSKYSNGISDIIFHENIYKCLQDFYGSEDNSRYVHYQSMHFDKSTATKLHQDTWYLDTESRSLVGIWIAMEDITEDCGPFCLYINSSEKIHGVDEFNFENIESDTNFTNRSPSPKRYDFHAKKGDILIWNSKVIHGALRPLQPDSTRKSLTSHYYPLGEKVKDQPIKRFISIYDHEHPKKTRNRNILQATTVNPIVYQSMCAALNKLGNKKNIFTKDKSIKKELNEIRNISK